MKKIFTLLTVFYCVIINAQTPITNANFKTAINTCLTTNPVDGLCTSSEYGAMPDWDVSQVTNMSNAFKEKSSFNGDISSWDVSNVVSMEAMFYEAEDFDQDISSWDVTSVTNMAGMFYNAYSFNQDLSSWCVTKITGSEPVFFSQGSPLNSSYKPAWGTCASPVTNTWKGTTDNNWATATNWSTSSVPTASQNITIPKGLTYYPTATSPVSFSTMTLKNGATFIPGNNAVTGNITYKRRLPNTDWYLISPPVSGESMQDVITNHPLATGSGTNVGLANFVNTDSNPWNYKSATSTGTLNAAQGYSVKLQSSADISFTGSANTSDVNYTVSGGNTNNFYLLGNPFTSYVNSTAFLNKNTAHLSTKSMWLWDGSAYQTYNLVSPLEIAPAQGFFVDIDDNVSNQNIVFETSNQSHQSTDTFMRESPIANFELSIESNNAKVLQKYFT